MVCIRYTVSKWMLQTSTKVLHKTHTKIFYHIKGVKCIASKTEFRNFNFYQLKVKISNDITAVEE